MTARGDAGRNCLISKPLTTADATTVGGWPLLDERVLGLLANEIGDDGANDVVRLFLTGAPRMIDRLEQSFASRGRVLLREVHTLASAACSVGLLRVGHVAADIERTFASAEPSGVRLAGLLALLHQSAARLAEWQATRQTAVTEVTCPR